MSNAVNSTGPARIIIRSSQAPSARPRTRPGRFDASRLGVVSKKPEVHRLQGCIAAPQTCAVVERSRNVRRVHRCTLATDAPLHSSNEPHSQMNRTQNRPRRGRGSPKRGSPTRGSRPRAPGDLAAVRS
jgi:hypothetical protein